MLLTLAALLCGATYGRAQAAPPTTPSEATAAPPAADTLSVDVRVVAVDAIVRTRQGELVEGLGRDAFSLRVDNHPVPIRYFNQDDDLPLTVGLMVDTSGSQRMYFDTEALAADTFLRDTLTHPQDRAFIVRFDSYVLLLQKMTSDQRALHSALRLLDGLVEPPLRGHGGTLLFDAIARVSSRVIGAEHGRRALVILTDGDDNGSQIDLAHTIRIAQMNDVAVYSVLYTREDPSYPRISIGRPSGIDVMRELAEQTGARSFVVGPEHSVASIFATIAQELRSQYRIGFTPPASAPGKFHKLELRTRDKSFSVQARSGYATPAEPAQP